MPGNNVNTARINKLRGAEESIFNLFKNSTRQDWAAWLQVPLQHAAARGDEALALRLIKAGAAIGTAVHEAVQGGHVELVATFVKKSGVPVDRTDSLGRNPLFVAATLGNAEMARCLLQLPDPDHRGEDEAATDMACSLTEKGTSSLYIAASRGFLDVMELFIENGCPPNLANSDGRTALHGAANKGQIDVIDLLARAGADLEAVGPINVGTPLDYAGAAANAASIVALLRHGAAVEGDPSQTISPLWRVVFSGSPTTQALLPLLRHGADVNALDVDRESALHRLCYKATTIPNVVEIVDLLLRWGADETIDNYICTPLDWLSEHHPTEGETVRHVRRLLENAPADRNWRRRGFLVLCRAFPERVRLNPTPASGSDADGSIACGPAAGTNAPESRSSSRRKLEIPPTSGGGGNRGGAPGGGGATGEVSASDSEGGWDSAVAAWMTKTGGEPAIFRHIVMCL